MHAASNPWRRDGLRAVRNRGFCLKTTAHTAAKKSASMRVRAGNRSRIAAGSVAGCWGYMLCWCGGWRLHGDNVHTFTHLCTTNKQIRHGRLSYFSSCNFLSAILARTRHNGHCASLTHRCCDKRKLNFLFRNTFPNASDLCFDKCVIDGFFFEKHPFVH